MFSLSNNGALSPNGLTTAFFQKYGDSVKSDQVGIWLDYALQSLQQITNSLCNSYFLKNLWFSPRTKPSIIQGISDKEEKSFVH